MEKVVVLGLGNQLMQDDGVGIFIVEELSKRSSHPNISYVIGEGDIDFCISAIEEVSFVIFIDAVISGKEPGEVSVFPLEQLYQSETIHLSPHNLHLFHVLHQQKEKIKGILIGVEPYEITFQIGLSMQLQKIWEQLIEKITMIIDECRKKKNVSDKI